MRTLEECRARIDALDAEIIALYEARMDVCREVAGIKVQAGMPVFQPAREQAVRDRAAARCQNVDHAPGARLLMDALMAASRALQRRALGDAAPEAPVPQNPVVAYCGVEGAFAEQAALMIYGPSARLIGYPSFTEAARAAASGEADFAVLPVENTLAGAVEGVAALIAGQGLTVAAEQLLPVRHHLLGLPGAPLDGICEVRSHPQALKQCTGFLSARPSIRTIVSDNTALAARDVATLGDASVAAIASLRAAKRYGLAVLAGDIQDAELNVTRFVALTRRAAP